MQEENNLPPTKFPKLVSLANLKPQSFPDAKNEFMRCQLGRHVHETRHVEVFEKNPGSEIGGRIVKYSLPVTLFHLIGYGDTWEAATEMALQCLGMLPPPEPSLEPSLTRVLTGT